MPVKIYRLRSEVWLYPGESANWHFVSIAKEISSDIRKRYGKGARGFGSLPVTVTLGETSWETSIFPDKRSSTYLLPLKAEIRKREHVRAGDHISVSLVIR